MLRQVPFWHPLKWLLFTLALLVAVPAHAQMSPQDQFIKGQSLYDEGQFEAALPFFDDAFKRTQSPNASLYVARCYEKLGRFPEAFTAMQKTVSLARAKAQEDDKYASTRDAAAAELVLLKPKVALVAVAFAEEYPDAVARLNDRELSSSQRGIPLAVMPGEVTIVGEAPGRESVTRTVEVKGGETKTVALALPEKGEVVDPDPVDGGPGFVITTTRAVGFGVAGLGVAGLVVFAITGSMASSKFDEVETGCMMVQCTDDTFVPTIDEGKTLQTVANVTAVVGGAALVAGVLMVVFGGPGDDEDDAETALSVVPVPGGIGLGGSF